MDEQNVVVGQSMQGQGAQAFDPSSLSKTSTAPPPTPLLTGEKELQESLAVLNMIVTNLYERLERVLSEPAPYPETTERSNTEDRSEHVRFLADATMNVREESKRIERLLDRLDV